MMYHQLLSDHKDLISNNITFDKIMSGLPHKIHISKDCCTKVTSEEREEEKVKRLLEDFLGRSQTAKELETLFNIIVKEEALSYLQLLHPDCRNKLKGRSFDGGSPAEISNDELDDKNEQPVSSRSASDVLPIVRPQDHIPSPSVEFSNLKRENVELRQELLDTKNQVSHLTEKLASVENKLEQYLSQTIKAKSEEMEKALAECKKVKLEMNDLRKQNTDLVKTLEKTTTELETTREKLNELKSEVSARTERVEEVEAELKRMETKRNKSKICQLM